MNKELTDILKYLRLANLSAHWEDYLKLAADKNFSHARLLAHVLQEANDSSTSLVLSFQPPCGFSARRNSRFCTRTACCTLS